MKNVAAICLKVSMAILVLGVSTTVIAKEGCWLEIFEKSQYEGKHTRLEGPLALENLTDVAGENWDKRIDSLKTGPNVKVTLYSNADFKLTPADILEHPSLMKSMGLTEKDVREDSELIFNSNAAIHDLSDFTFHHKTRSLKIECQ
jgi:hypothetical protein